MFGASRFIAILALLNLSAVAAEPLTIAVASNFRAPAEAIAEQFRRDTGYPVRLSSASTVKLYAQIVNGAPFDIFLAADARHPELLEQAGLAVSDSRQSYALGGLVLWSADPAMTDGNCRDILDDLGGLRLAIANPETAPYGIAAKQFLVAEDLWSRVESRVVYGESIAQALHFAATGNASLGLISRSQAFDTRLSATTCAWPVPEKSHDPIEQQAVLLQRASDSPAATAFMTFLAGSAAAVIVNRFGYGIPE